MDNYLVDDNSNKSRISFETQSYLIKDEVYRTELGLGVCDDVPILQGDDNIFSELDLTGDEGYASHKAKEFILEFTRVFVKKKTANRSYSKFLQNKNELPDIELDWAFQYFRVSFLFSANDEDYYCITKYEEKTGKYDSTSGPIKKELYKSIAEEVMQKVN